MEADDLACVLFLSAGSQGMVSLQRFLWDGHSNIVDWKDEDFHQAFLCLKDLALEGKVTIIIDGLDEIGHMTSKEVSNASQAAANPHMEVDLKTACAGILTQKILPGASLQLVKERKVDVTHLKNSAEVYLMFSMKNLDFHTDQNESFTELDPPEHQVYLKWAMMMCQEQLQNSEEGTNINTIVGISRNVKGEGLCFEKMILNEKLQIPLDFIKKLGFFDIRKEQGGNVFLDVVHLSYLEFCCAGSLCRKGVNIEEELSKIKDTDRFEAVTTYMAGLFSQNPSINFLNDVKHIAKNFLLLLGNDEREICIQTVFRAIMKRPQKSQKATIQFSIPDESEFTLHGSRHILMLVEALKASSDRIKPKPTIREIYIADANDREAVESVFQLIELQCYPVEKLSDNECDTTRNLGLLTSCVEKAGVRNIKLGNVFCKTKSAFEAVCSMISVSRLENWNIESLKLEVENANPWAYLSKTSGRGSIKSFSVGEPQSVRYWVREEVEAVKTSIDELRFYPFFSFYGYNAVACSTNEEVNTLCIALGLAKR